MKTRTLGLAALAVALTACGSAATSSVPGPLGSPPPGATVESSRPSSVNPGGPSPRALTTATPTPDSRHQLRSVPWTLRAEQDGGRKLLITYSAGGCATDGGVHVTQTSSYVMLAAYNVIPKLTNEPMACPALALVVFGTVTLDEPLGGRPLYHAPVNPQ